jgi:hypothetical protein
LVIGSHKYIEDVAENAVDKDLAIGGGRFAFDDKSRVIGNTE